MGYRIIADKLLRYVTTIDKLVNMISKNTIGESMVNYILQQSRTSGQAASCDR